MSEPVEVPLGALVCARGHDLGGHNAVCNVDGVRACSRCVREDATGEPAPAPESSGRTRAPTWRQSQTPSAIYQRQWKARNPGKVAQYRKKARGESP